MKLSDLKKIVAQAQNGELACDWPTDDILALIERIEKLSDALEYTQDRDFCDEAHQALKKYGKEVEL